MRKKAAGERNPYVADRGVLLTLRAVLRDLQPKKPVSRSSHRPRSIPSTSSRHRRELLGAGGGRLLIAGDIEEVLPLDDADLLDATSKYR